MWAAAFTPLGGLVGVRGGAAAAAAAAPGHVWINSEPWGLVYIDGDSIGSTPVINHALTAGTHTLSIRRDGYQAVERPFDLSPGQELRLTGIGLVRAP
jgi:hypothetical protein